MSRQRDYSDHRTLMSNIDTDLEELRLETPPSPPRIPMERNSSEEEEEDGETREQVYQLKHHRHDPPETPYYDYACTCHLR